MKKFIVTLTDEVFESMKTSADKFYDREKDIWTAEGGGRPTTPAEYIADALGYQADIQECP